MTMDAKHPIGVVSARTGLPQDLIRAWERRYQAVTPGRGATGRRLYSDDDIEKLRLLRRAVMAGRRISDVAALPIDVLKELVAEDRNETVLPDGRARRTERSVSSRALLDEALESIEALDRHRLEHLLREASVVLSAPALREEFIGPLMETIGERWHNGSMRVAHEHMASVTVRGFMAERRNGHGRNQAPRMVVTTPAGQHHEVGALMATTVAEEGGWDACYLGPDLPAEEIAGAVRQLGARAVAISVIYRGSDTSLLDELARLRRLVDPSIPIFAGGRAAVPLRERMTQLGLIVPTDLSEFRAELHGSLS
jgi:MerR family transcriptional regulator, light-induced transcriptional regulator